MKTLMLALSLLIVGCNKTYVRRCVEAKGAANILHVDGGIKIVSIDVVCTDARIE